MATYNGERHLPQQLKSILEQSELPDELIVSDDGSSDGTLAILRDFKKISPFVVKVLVREKPLGFACNFSGACLHATGDVIIFCDQDDFWRAEKVGAIKAYFVANPEKELVLHDISVCDADLRPMVNSYFSYLLSESHDPDYLVKGCATAIRKSLRDRAYPLPLGGRWTHDCRVHALANLSGTRGIIGMVLCDYRVHASNTSGYVLPKNNWKGAIAARLKRKSLSQSSLAYTTLQYFSLRNITEPELKEFYWAHLGRGQSLAAGNSVADRGASFSTLKVANDLLNKRSQIAEVGSHPRKLLGYLQFAAGGGYADAGGGYSLAGDVLRIFGKRK